MSARIEEIRQENRSGDVSYNDIEWLCSVAEAAEALIERTDLGEVGRREVVLSRLLSRLLRSRAQSSQSENE